MITIKLDPAANAVISRLGMVPELSVNICGAMDKENQLTVDAIKQKISGSPEKGLRGSQVLHRRSGRLRDSIGRTDTLASRQSGNIYFRSGIGSGVGQGHQSVRYAAIHEFGGAISVPSRPTRSVNPRWARLHPQTKAYTVKMPKRSYIASTIKTRAVKYSDRLGKTIVRFWSKGGSSV